MKKSIQKYLAKLQENNKKGFSLVELIIVMAIMAILVGVVASQVLPYMEKSRQTKDQQQLSSLGTDMISAISQADKAVDATGIDGQLSACSVPSGTGDWVTELGTIRSADGSTVTSLSDIEKEIVNKFKSKKATDTTNGMKVYVHYNDGSSAHATCPKSYADCKAGAMLIWTGDTSYTNAPSKLKVVTE